MFQRVLVFLCSALILSCGGGANADLTVNLRSDYVPQVDFTSVRIALRAGDANETVATVPASESDYTRGEFLTNFGDLKQGDYVVRAELLAEDGRIVGSRSNALTLSQSTAVTLVITQSCRGVECPGGGDPSFTECSGGRCVAPGCSPETPAFCDEGCLSNEECNGSVACAEGVCLAEGACLSVPNDALCDENEFCDPRDGCQLRPDVVLPDMGMPDLRPVECDMPCDVEGRPCAEGRFDCSTGTPVCMETGGGANAGAVCRAAVDLCDADDACDGVSPECPEEDGKQEAGFVCRTAVDECDVSEVCDGTSNACPANVFQPVGTRCVDGGFCNGDHICSDTCEPDAPCQPEGMPCSTGRTDCTSGVPQCVPNGNQPNGVECAATEIGPWNSCSFTGTCAETGTEMRTVTEFECRAGTCEPDPRTETQPCSRDTDGNRCGSDIVGGWEACMGFDNTCDETGMQIQQVTTPTCVAGTCSNQTSTNSRGCMRDTDGTGCGMVTRGPFGACDYSSTCDETATRTRTVTTPTCGGASCGNVTSSESESCTRNTDGIGCGTVTFGAWSACSGFSDVCDRTGTRSRSVFTPTCSSGGCGTVTTSQSESCTRTNPGRNYNQTCCTGAGVTPCAQGACLNNRCVAFGGGYAREAVGFEDPRVCRGNPLDGGACSCPDGFIDEALADMDNAFDEGNGTATVLHVCRGANDSPGADFRGAYGENIGNLRRSRSTDWRIWQRGCG
ncbi:MAG: hypothetical protein AAF938_13015, partial [Myxococcota bacterium]